MLSKETKYFIMSLAAGIIAILLIGLNTTNGYAAGIGFILAVIAGICFTFGTAYRINTGGETK